MSEKREKKTSTKPKAPRTKAEATEEQPKKRKPQQRRTAAQVAADTLRVSELYYVAKLTQNQIAERLELSPSTVSRHLKELEERWQAKAEVTVENAIAEKLAELAQLRRMNMDGWERSCEPLKKRKAKSSDKGLEITLEVIGNAPYIDDVKDEMKEKLMHREGNPTFLENIRKLLELEVELLGIAPPKKIAPTTPDGKEPYKSERSIEDYTALLQAAKRVRAEQEVADDDDD